ncbi:ornithine carbamoyltransferase [Robertmurraya kyonggiensis]|uniref:Ornithine carbamoyltransferase n=1 Tax=Robertmurraya kyonggiensis TaxID=1037680 RepID=A0A4U1D745_9BACI|nr:ornithine carbamoyltransferase [Robertmurraya kyonggiensis]TKC18264.1 ornithine carbamoyltransferase [Robertmurraya kyonggiensis]
MIAVKDIPHELNIKGKDLLTLADYSSETIEGLLDLAIQLKNAHLSGEETPFLKGKILGLIFDKPSTRTRVSFEAGMLQLGGQVIHLNGQELQLGRGEPVSDTAKVLSHYIDAVMIRTFSHKKVEELAEHATIPIINGLTDLYHPCQALADLLTVIEVKGSLNGIKMAYIGDGNNVAHSLMIAAAKTGMKLAVASPKGYEPNAVVLSKAQEFAKQTGAEIIVTNSPSEAVVDADVIYTDVWTSMGQEAENEQRLKDFEGYQVNEELVKGAKDDFMFLHCLPAHREEEVTAAIIDGKHSYVFQQAGNRLHAQKALLVEILK